MAITNILERIQVSGSRLGVTKTDIAQELVRLADAGDAEGLRTLFATYCEWEVRQSAGEDPTAQRTRCLDNFYVAAQIGDAIRNAGGDILQGFTAFQDNPDVTGVTTQFVSTTLQYTPPPDANAQQPPQ